jgi:nucleoside-diphosphate-sugar epimerase
MRVMVTGGSGRIGQAVVTELLEHGHAVVNADRRPPVGATSASADTFREVHLGDVGQVVGAMAGCDAVIHLGAIPSPNRHPDEVVFGNNTGATFAVLQAASLLGVRKAVVASSVSALGTAYAVRRFKPLYAPVDEAHPLLSQDPYALSKEVDERTCEMFHRRTGMQVLAYRFHWVALPEESGRRANELREHLEQQAHLLWGWVDVRDVAQACRLGIEVDGLGYEAFNIIAGDTLSDVPTMELIEKYAPEVEVRERIEGTDTAWSIDKARRMLDYRPRHTWRGTGESGGTE